MTRHSAWQFPCIFAVALLLPGCDRLSERAGFPDPVKQEAEGKAIGGACRHAGRGLEDCYRLNKEAPKSSVYAGWKEMNEYMVKNNMQAVKPTIPAKLELIPGLRKRSADTAEDDEPADVKPGKTAQDEDADAGAPKDH